MENFTENFTTLYYVDDLDDYNFISQLRKINKDTEFMRNTFIIAGCLISIVGIVGNK